MRFFYREQICGRSVYHWHRSCQLVPRDLELRQGWVMLAAEPRDRARCNNCVALEAERADTTPVEQQPAGVRRTAGASR